MTSSADQTTPVQSMEAFVSRLALEYAATVPAAAKSSSSLDSSLSLREDLAIESLSLVSLALRLGDELGVDVVELNLDLGPVRTIGDLVAVGHRLSSLKGEPKKG